MNLNPANQEEPESSCSGLFMPSTEIPSKEQTGRFRGEPGSVEGLSLGGKVKHPWRKHVFNRTKTREEKSIGDFIALKAEKTRMTRRAKWVIFLFFLMTSPCFAWTDSEIADAIYKAENSEKYPYGIKSINTHGDKVLARKICLNTIRNNRKRFANQTKYTDFIEFLGSRYCPPSIHKLNRNWVTNVRYFLGVNR